MPYNQKSNDDVQNKGNDHLFHNSFPLTIKHKSNMGDLNNNSSKRWSKLNSIRHRSPHDYSPRLNANLT